MCIYLERIYVITELGSEISRILSLKRHQSYKEIMYEITNKDKVIKESNKTITNIIFVQFITVYILLFIFLLIRLLKQVYSSRRSKYYFEVV